MVAGLCACFIRPGRLIGSAIVFKPSTLLNLHRALIQRKYRRLFSSDRPVKPGPKGPCPDVIAAVADMKQRNPSWGCPRIAQQITLAFGIAIDRDVVRRILATRYKPKPGSAGPSWLTVLGHAKDSLWSVDLFRCESAVLHSYWVLVVMDHWTRRIVGFGVHRGVVDGVALCRMFNRASSGQALPTYLSADHDPLCTFHQWQPNLRIINIREIKTVRYVPRSHPVVERLIGTVRRECLDRLLFWTAADLERKLVEFQQYYNEHRTHAGHPTGAELGHDRRSGESARVSVAAALSWPVSHAESRVTSSIRSALTRAIYEFATHTISFWASGPRNASASMTRLDKPSPLNTPARRRRLVVEQSLYNTTTLVRYLLDRLLS